MGSEPDSVSAWTEQHSIMNDPTFVGTGAAALLGCMAQFEQSLCAVSERYRPTIFLDPRENQHGWLVPSSLDKELWKAKIVSGSLPPPIGCVQKKYAVHFPCAVGCPDITEQDWGPRPPRPALACPPLPLPCPSPPPPSSPPPSPPPPPPPLPPPCQPPLLLLLARLLLLRLFNRIVLASDSCGVGNKTQNAKKQTRRAASRQSQTLRAVQ